MYVVLIAFCNPHVLELRRPPLGLGGATLHLFARFLWAMGAWARSNDATRSAISQAHAYHIHTQYSRYRYIHSRDQSDYRLSIAPQHSCKPTYSMVLPYGFLCRPLLIYPFVLLRLYRRHCMYTTLISSSIEGRKLKS
ncbi:hypothetical protein F5Y17DRAFT_196842 [Xylariaceae sp. FL0594]|nr:hypothetical protein F5Y17DRAFT_196842 [Xylariaceae sp. FL0594]